MTATYKYMQMGGDGAGRMGKIAINWQVQAKKEENTIKTKTDVMAHDPDNCVKDDRILAQAEDCRCL